MDKRPKNISQQAQRTEKAHICSLRIDREAQMLEDHVDSRRHPTRKHGRKSFTECSYKGLFKVASRRPCRGRWTVSLVCASHTLPISIKWGFGLMRQLNRKRHFAAKPDNWDSSPGDPDVEGEN